MSECEKAGFHPIREAEAGLRTLYAGVARSNLTTDDETAVINDPLYAKALVLDDGKTRIVLITMDITAIGGRGVGRGMLEDIGEDFLPRLRNRIEHELQIPGANILVNASHTHPAGRLLCDDDQQLERTFDAVKQAVRNMIPVKLGVGVGYEDRIMVNRTLRLKNGDGWTIRQASPCPRDDEVADIGPVDPEIGVFRIDHPDGRPMAVVYNFACHPLIGVPGGGITASYPGFASKVIEENLDGATAFFLQGASGNITELSYKDVTRPRDCEPVGIMLGLSTLRAVRKIETGKAELKVISRTVDFPRRTDIPDKIKALLSRQDELLKSLRFTSLNLKTFIPLYIKYALNPEYPSDYVYRYMHAERRGSSELADLDSMNRKNLEKYLSNIDAMEKLAKIQDDIATLKKHQAINEEAGEPTIKAEIMGIRIGNGVLISSPAEVLVEVGLNIKKASQYRYTFIAAFSNGYMHYGPPACYYDNGSYEGTECFLAPQWQEIYEKTVLEIISNL